MKRVALSPRQRDVYTLILKAHQDGHPCPSYKEISEALGIRSLNGVAEHVEALVRKGWIRRSGTGSARSLIVVGERRGARKRLQDLEVLLAQRNQEVQRLTEELIALRGSVLRGSR